MAFCSVSLRQTEKKLRQANSYADWAAAALQHDKISGMERWKSIEQSPLYDHTAIRRRLDGLRLLRKRQDFHGLLFALNEGIHGNMGGMGGAELYSNAMFGTKQLISDYIDEVGKALELLASLDDQQIDFEQRLDFFRRASHCFGRSALMFSGAGMLVNFHVGVAKVLLEQDLLPSVISGSSAGALVAAVLGTHTKIELSEIFQDSNRLIEARQEASWISRLMWSRHPLIDVQDIRATIERLIPDMTFQEAFEKTGININIPIAPAELHQTSRLLNVITSPNVFIRSAVLASCSVPGVFPPAALEAKNVHGSRQPYLPSRKWVDGSVTDDMPAKRLARLYGVNHYIVSQTNPLVLPFLAFKESSGVAQWIFEMSNIGVRESLRCSQNFTRKYASHWPRLGLLLNTYYSLVAQDYTGDINIIPRYKFVDPRKLLSPLTEKEVLTLIRAGEQATWSSVERIRLCTSISHKLDNILQQFKDEERRRATKKAPAKISRKRVIVEQESSEHREQ